MPFAAPTPSGNDRRGTNSPPNTTRTNPEHQLRESSSKLGPVELTEEVTRACHGRDSDRAERVMYYAVDAGNREKALQALSRINFGNDPEAWRTFGRAIGIFGDANTHATPQDLVILLKNPAMPTEVRESVLGRVLNSQNPKLLELYRYAARQPGMSTVLIAQVDNFNQNARTAFVELMAAEPGPTVHRLFRATSRSIELLDYLFQKKLDLCSLMGPDKNFELAIALEERWPKVDDHKLTADRRKILQFVRSCCDTAITPDPMRVGSLLRRSFDGPIGSEVSVAARLLCRLAKSDELCRDFLHDRLDPQDERSLRTPAHRLALLTELVLGPLPSYERDLMKAALLAGARLYATTQVHPIVEKVFDQVGEYDRKLLKRWGPEILAAVEGDEKATSWLQAKLTSFTFLGRLLT